MPIVEVKGNKTKMLMAKVSPSKGMNAHAVEIARRFTKQLG